MSIIVRPASGVFRRTMPLVVVFGAYRSFEDQDPLDAVDLETVTDAVALARRMHIPLAFSRAMRKDGTDARGVWLPDCRPKVSDRVFDHPEGSAFQNREFLNVFTKIIEREVFAVGPRNDSSMGATARETEATGRVMRIVMAAHPLQKCSTLRGIPSPVYRFSRNFDLGRDVPFTNWADSVCDVEHMAS